MKKNHVWTYLFNLRLIKNKISFSLYFDKFKKLLAHPLHSDARVFSLWKILFFSRKRPQIRLRAKGKNKERNRELCTRKREKEKERKGERGRNWSRCNEVTNSIQNRWHSPRISLIRYALGTLRYVPGTNQVIIRVDVNYISETRDTAELTVSWNTVTMRRRDIMGIPRDFCNTEVPGSLFGAGIFMVRGSVPSFVNVSRRTGQLSTNSAVHRRSKIADRSSRPNQFTCIPRSSRKYTILFSYTFWT